MHSKIVVVVGSFLITSLEQHWKETKPIFLLVHWHPWEPSLYLGSVLSASFDFSSAPHAHLCMDSVDFEAATHFDCFHLSLQRRLLIHLLARCLMIVFKQYFSWLTIVSLSVEILQACFGCGIYIDCFSVRLSVLRLLRVSDVITRVACWRSYSSLWKMRCFRSCVHQCLELVLAADAEPYSQELEVLLLHSYHGWQMLLQLD